MNELNETNLLMSYWFQNLIRLTGCLCILGLQLPEVSADDPPLYAPGSAATPYKFPAPEPPQAANKQAFSQTPGQRVFGHRNYHPGNDFYEPPPYYSQSHGYPGCCYPYGYRRYYPPGGIGHYYYRRPYYYPFY